MSDEKEMVLVQTMHSDCKEKLRWKNGEDAKLLLLQKIIFVIVKSLFMRISLSELYLQRPGLHAESQETHTVPASPSFPTTNWGPLSFLNSWLAPLIHPHCSALCSTCCHSSPWSLYLKFCFYHLQYKLLQASRSTFQSTDVTTWLQRLKLNASHHRWNEVESS